MPKEQEAIERLNRIIKTKFNNDYSIDSSDKEAIETVLNMLKEKDKKIEYYKKQKDYDDQFKHELLEQIRCLNLDKDEKDKQIDLMGEVIFEKFKAQLVIEYGIENKEQFIKLFEKKIKE